MGEHKELILKLKFLASNVISSPQKDVLEKLNKIKEILDVLPPEAVESQAKVLMGAFCFYLRPSEALRTKLEVKERLVLNLTSLFEKTTVRNVNVYKNVNGFLLYEIYDPGKNSKVKENPEEYKLVVVNCVKSLHNRISSDVVKAAYNKEFIMVLSSLVYVCLGLAQHEKLRCLRVSSIECIMSVAMICGDVTKRLSAEIFCVTADIFMHFFPGICRVLTNIALEDQKTGHKVICSSIRCLGKITWLVMQDHTKNGSTLKASDFRTSENQSPKTVGNKWKNSEEIREYLKNVNRNTTWFVKTDAHLYDAFGKLLKLCYHVHEKVRLEFGLVCEEIVKSCHYTMPRTSSKIFEALVTMSEDVDEDVAKIAREALGYLEVLKADDAEFYKKLFDDFETSFFETMNEVPSIFHGVDDNKKLSQVNLLCGYLKIFKQHKISTLLYDAVNLRLFTASLLTICTVDKLNMRLFDEYTIQDFELKDVPMRSKPWKVFKFHSDVNVSRKLRELFQLLSDPEMIEDIFYYLKDVFETEKDYKKEATLLLNDIVSGCENEQIRNEFSKSLILTYLEDQNLNVPINTSKSITLNATHENIVQICLQLEGVGTLALCMGPNNCRKLLLKMLYPIIEKAGSLNPLVRLSGLQCLADVARACEFASVTELINKNSDYFSYHVTRKLKHYESNKSVLDVYGVVMKHCSVEILESVADILENVSKRSIDEDQIPFLRIYDVFLRCVMRWFEIKIVRSPVRSKREKLGELYEERNELLETARDFSDETSGKSAEELWRETKCEKIKLPVQIKLTIATLKTSLNYLSCPNDDVKILVLGILRNGVEIIRDYEDELLPIVHKIWTHLQYRFKSSTTPLIFNLSFQLLVMLAKVSRDFIRRRTSEKALPAILNKLEDLAKKSYLKDRGSEYRTTQTYKLQSIVLENLDKLITDIDIASEDMLKVFKATESYLSDKQPLPLQKMCVSFYQTMLFYDPEATKGHLTGLNNEEYKRNVESVIKYGNGREKTS